MLSGKKKNAAGKTYTLDELETEINSLSGPEGKTVTFRNLDSTGKQHIEVFQPSLSWSQNNGNDLSITSKYPTINFWVSSSEGYVPGTLDHESPLDLSTIQDDMVITASTGYMQSGEKQLVDMSNWNDNNEDTAFDSEHNFTNATLEYFKSIKPTSLNNAFKFNYVNSIKSIGYLNLLDTSECVSFNHFLYINFLDITSQNTIFIHNLSGLNTSKVTDFRSCFRIEYDTKIEAIIDISGWDTSKGENFQNFISINNKMIKSIEIKGIIDLVSDKTSYNYSSGNYFIGNGFFDGAGDLLASPIKFKNVPSDFNWQAMGFTSEDQFQILSYR